MYRRFRTGVDSVEDVVQRSLSNLSVTDLKPSVSEEEPSCDPEVIRRVQECWEEIGSQCMQYGHRSKYSRIKDAGEWRTVRVFVSSTFTDFFCEREVLVKKVFPELREWCRERMLYLVDCDMRWGVPRDTTTADTIAVCLEELDRCMDETDGEPFFLNMIGERYGWIPALEDIQEEVQKKFHWVPNTSITFMEILHGAYRMQNPNALFMMRDGSILGDIPDRLLPRYRDTDDLQVEHLKHLKTWLQSRFPEQVHEYSCSVEGTVNIHGKEMANITKLDDFCEKVLQFFKAAITRKFPHRDSVQQQDSRILIENENQKKFVEEVAGGMLGRKDEADQILSFLQNKPHDLKTGEMCKKPFARDPTFWHELIDLDNALLCLSGQQGYGKTTLLAYVTHQAIKNGMDVFYHFCGGSGNSHHASLLLQRLAAFLKQDFSTDYLETLYQSDDGKLREIIHDGFLALNKKPVEKPILFVFDALNQLSTANSVNHLSWLPPKFPRNVYCIVSSTNHPPTISRIQEYLYYSKELEALKTSDAQDIIKLFLQRFNKRLDNDQLKLILDSKCSENPLWLYFICEELRIYGDFRSLTRQVQAVSTSVEGLIETILRRLINEDAMIKESDGNLIEKSLCLMACSNAVITALDLQCMLGDISKKEPLPMLLWAQVRRNLSAYLRVANYNDQITFAHATIKSVVHNCIIRNSEESKQWHTIHANYIEYWCDNRTLKIESLPYHLQKAGLRKRIVHFVREIPESAQIPSFRRSAIITECRCRNLADPVIKGVMQAYLCKFCQHKRAAYFPGGYHTNERMCVVCGNMVFSKPLSTSAFMCNFHSVHQNATSPRCFLCSNVSALKMLIPANLCQHCGFGNNGKRCVALDMHL